MATGTYEALILDAAKAPRRAGLTVEAFKQAAARARKADLAYTLGEAAIGRTALIDALRWLRTDTTGHAADAVARIEAALVADGAEV